jgi:two-component system CheB/CheR fusion protein
MKNRVFRKAANVNMRDRLLVMAQTSSEEVNSQVVDQVRLREAAFETATVAQIVIDTTGILILANEKARSLFHLDAHDLGRPFQDLELSYRPVDLRSAIDQAYARNGQVVLQEIEMPFNSSETCYLDVMLVPLKNGSEATIGISVSFLDITEHKRLQNQLEDANQELETAMEELQSTNEELETTNEELQSTIEELETTNEELQSTNEELETMNEELQSTNEELETMNDEMSQRSEELNQVNSFLESILTGLRGGVIVLDADLNVKVWNQKSADLWGLRASEVEGHNFLGLDIGLPVDQLKKPARDVLSGEVESLNIPLSATNRRGRHININVTVSPLLTAQKEIRGIILVMEQVQNAGG